MKRSIIVLVTILTLTTMSSRIARADQSLCGTAPGVQSQTVSPGAGTFGVYAKMNMPGQQAELKSYVSLNGICAAVGSASVNGNTWTKIGDYTFTGQDTPSFELDGALPEQNDGAAKPQILLVPSNNPCTPKSSCETTVGGEAAYLSPVSLSTNDSGIIIQKIIDPAKDTIKEVQYYASGQLMYTSATLQPFNLAYADYYDQKLARVIVYESKQRAVLESTVPSTYLDTVPNAVMRLFVAHATLVWSILAGLLITALIITARRLARHYEEVSYFNYAHGLGNRNLTPLQARFKAIVRSTAFRVGTTLGIVAFIVISALVTTTIFIITPYRVDGTSMYATLQDKQLMAINKLPVSFSKQFQPTRGQVIIFHPNYGTLAYSDLRVDNVLVKRVIALPGERIVSNGGKHTVYNTDHPNGYVLEDTEPWGNKVTIQPADEPFDITLQNNQIFVAGDNRPHSIDSRIHGALPLSEVIGVVVVY